MILKFTTLFFAALFFVSCGNEPKRKAEGTWFGGEIVNPTDHLVTLKKGDTLIAEIPLNQNHRFLYQFKKFSPGLYEFYHGERQLVYLEEGDSLMLRLNTYEFDESLTFSGYGASENNLLVSLFLRNEEDNSYMSQNNIFQKSPEQFESFIDSLMTVRQTYSENFEKDQDFSKPFDELANAVIRYNLYAHKEAYPLLKNTDSKTDLIQSLPASFYDYHKGLRFDHLEYLPTYAYQRFLLSYFNLAAFKKYAKVGPYNNKSYTHIDYEMRLIDSMVSNKTIKSFLVTRSLRDYLTHNDDLAEGKKLYGQYLDMAPLPSDRKEMNKLFTSFKNMARQQPIPNETLVDTHLKQRKLRDVIRRPTVLYFWSEQRQRHMQRAAAKAQTIREHFPQYDVLALNMDQEPKKWIQELDNLKIPAQDAFQFKDRQNEVLEDMAINSALKTIITDKNGIILDANANMFSKDFEEKLLGYINVN